MVFFFFFFFKALDLKVWWSLDWEPSQHHLRAGYKCRSMGPASGVRNQKPWGRALGTCVLTGPPGDSDVHLGVRTTGSVQSVWERLYSRNKNHLARGLPWSSG